MPTSAVVIVADRRANASGIARELSDDSYEVKGPMDPLEALRCCTSLPAAAILVDVELRDLSVGEFCALLRGRAGGVRIPILLFGAPQMAPVAAAFAGAEGYVSAADVPAIRQRLRALVRRASTTEDEPLIVRYEGRHLRARFDRVEIIVDGVRVDLARRELALLQFLVTHADRVLGRSDILSHVWRDRNGDRSRTLDTHIRRLRMKLGTAGTQIQTVPGVGYRFSES